MKFLALLLLLLGCQKPQKVAPDLSWEIQENKYAQHFSIAKSADLWRLQALSPWKNSLDTFTYYLSHSAKSLNSFPPEQQVVIPLKKTAAMSTNYIPWYQALKIENTLYGVETIKLISSSFAIERFEQGQLIELGSVANIQGEQLIQHKLDAMFLYGISNHIKQELTQIKKSQTPLFLLGTHQETHPLGQLEWIKFFSHFFSKSDLADSIFNDIEIKYNQQKNTLVNNNRPQPNILLGAPWKGDWYVAGGKSYMAQYIKDAGGHYVYESLKINSNKPYSFEEVYFKNKEANFWLHPSSHHSLSSLKLQDNRFVNFSAFQQQNVWNNNKKTNLSGGNDWFESAASNPHLVLKELQALFYPTQFPDHKFVWYQQLK